MCLKTVRVLVEASCRGRCLAYIMPDKTLIVYQFGIIDQQQAPSVAPSFAEHTGRLDLCYLISERYFLPNPFPSQLDGSMLPLLNEIVNEIPWGGGVFVVHLTQL